MSYIYPYPRPAYTADIILFRYREKQLQTLLIKRKDDPFKNLWAYPGGFVDEGETAIQAAYRELKEETGLDKLQLHTLFTDSELERDPRGWTISSVFYGFAPRYAKATAGDDASEVHWFNVKEIPELAFDHKLLYRKSMQELKALVYFKVLGMELLRKTFSKEDISRLYTIILTQENLADKYINRLIKTGVVDSTNNELTFNPEKLEETINYGFI